MYHCWQLDGHPEQLGGWEALYLQLADLQSTCDNKTAHQQDYRTCKKSLYLMFRVGKIMPTAVSGRLYFSIAHVWERNNLRKHAVG